MLQNRPAVFEEYEIELRLYCHFVAFDIVFQATTFYFGPMLLSIKRHSYTTLFYLDALLSRKTAASI